MWVHRTLTVWERGVIKNIEVRVNLPKQWNHWIRQNKLKVYYSGKTKGRGRSALFGERDDSVWYRVTTEGKVLFNSQMNLFIVRDVWEELCDIPTTEEQFKTMLFCSKI
jgi:hypothetical protein